MNDVDPSSDVLVRDLKRLFAHELERARTDPPVPRSPRNRGSSVSAGIGFAILGVLGIAIAAIALKQPDQLVALGPTGTPSIGTSTANATMTPTDNTDGTAAPSAVPASIGPLVNGLPAKIGSQPVRRGPDLSAAIASSTDDGSFLAGGWFHEGRVVRFCPMPISPRAVEACNSFALYADVRGGEPLQIARGDDGLLPGYLATEATRPVVLRIHTHDPRCFPEDTGCDLRPVLLEIVWLGDVAHIE
jgi:hypothetical protein